MHTADVQDLGDLSSCEAHGLRKIALKRQYPDRDENIQVLLRRKTHLLTSVHLPANGHLGPIRQCFGAFDLDAAGTASDAALEDRKWDRRQILFLNGKVNQRSFMVRQTWHGGRHV